VPVYSETGQKLLTPQDLEGRKWPETGRFSRGVDRAAVEQCVTEMTATLTYLYAKNRRLFKDAEKFHGLWQEAGGTRPASSGNGSGIPAETVRAVQDAQATADRYVADAMAYSAKVTADCRTSAQQILEQARERAKAIETEAEARGTEAAVLSLAGPPPELSAPEVAAELARVQAMADFCAGHLSLLTQETIRLADYMRRILGTPQPDTPREPGRTTDEQSAQPA
jgi:cell division septum initiation protein DivIVA